MAAPLRRGGAALAAAVVGLGALAGPPYGLVRLGRLLLEVDWRRQIAQPEPAVLLLAAVFAAGWLLWGWLLAASVAATVGRCRAAVRTRPRLPVPLHAAVTNAAGGVAMIAASIWHGGAGPAVPATPGTAAATAAFPVPDGTAVVDHGGPTGQPTVDPARQPPPAAAPARQPAKATGGHRAAAAFDSGQLRSTSFIVSPRRYTVRRGDTLWDLAGAWLGDPHRWPEIYRLNADRYDRHGRMRGGNHIEPDWVLDMPDDAAPPGGARTGPAPRDPGAPQNPGPQTGPDAGPSDAPAPSTPPAPSASAPAVTGPSAAGPSRGDGSTGSPGAAPSQTSDPDGVTDQPLPGQTSSSATAQSPSSPPLPAADPARTPRPDAGPHRPRGVTLPGGSWLDLGLAVAVAAAVTLVWAHRRRRYTRRPPSPQPPLDHPDVAPMPPVVNQIRRRLRRATAVAAAGNPHEPAAPDGDSTADDTGAVPAELPEAGALPDRADEHDTDAEEEYGDEDGGAAALAASTPPRPADGAAARPVAPSLAHPLASVWPPAGLGLTGPGAQAAARGLLTAALAAGDHESPDERNRVVLPAPTAVTLLGDDAAAQLGTPRLMVTAGLDEALELLEAQTLHRSRIVYAHEVDTIAELRAADPAEEPLPPILLLAEPATRHQRTRIAALLAQGQRLDIHGVLLGAWPDGDTAVVAGDGTTSRADGEGARHGSHPADLNRLTVLTPAETNDLLGVLAESHTGRPPVPAPAAQTTDSGARATAPATPPDRHANLRPDPGQASGDPATDLRGGRGSGATPSTATAAGDGSPDAPDRVPLAAPAPAACIGPDTGSGVEDRAVDTRATAVAAGDPASDPPAGGAADAVVVGGDEPETGDAAGDNIGAGSGRVAVTVLGTAGIVDAAPGPPLRRKSLEVLVYLAVHDGAAAAEAILDDLLPDAPASKAPHRLYTYVSDLRTVMRRTGGRGTYLTHPNHRYALNRDTVDVDLWRMRAAIRDAGRATDRQERIGALRRAVELYRGHLADGADYEWIEPYREAVRLQALDVYLALAEALADDPAAQLTVLDAAIRHNPYVEELYQHAMRARAMLGHLDAVRTLYRAVTRALGEIDAAPNDATVALADELVTQAQRPSSLPARRPAARTGDGAAA